MAARPGRLERRRGILDAARKVFAARGYAATRMSDIAATARVGKGTLYTHFRSKANLFSTLVVSTMREAIESLTTLSLSRDPVEALRQVIAECVQLVLDENLDLYRLFFDFWGVAANQRSEARRYLREGEASFRAFLGELIRRGQREGVFRPEADADLVVRALSAALDGLSLRMVILGEDVDLAAYTAVLQEVFVRSIAQEPVLRGASIMQEREKEDSE